MASSELGAWAPLEVAAVVEAFAGARFRWWIGGGRALDLFVGRSWRVHDDTDVGIARRDAGALHDLLHGWDLHVAAAGRLRPWRGGELRAERDENNVWCRRDVGDAWMLDVTIGDGDADDWIFRRDPRVRVPWDRAVLTTSDGVPYLAPELQLLFKSRDPRPKDDVDAGEVLPALGPERQEWLAHHLPPDHPWRALLPEST